MAAWGMLAGSVIVGGPLLLKCSMSGYMYYFLLTQGLISWPPGHFRWGCYRAGAVYLA
jgi:hypothetical protein